MKKLTKAQDLINELKQVAPEDYAEIKENTERIKKEFRGGYRPNAGRKFAGTARRSHTIRVTDEEKSIIDLIRTKNINLCQLQEKYC